MLKIRKPEIIIFRRWKILLIIEKLQIDTMRVFHILILVLILIRRDNSMILFLKIIEN